MPHFPSSSYFEQLSHFRGGGLGDPPVGMHDNQPKLEPKVAAKTRTIDNKTLEDWAHRAEQAAYEAGDERLPALHSDLLDLRDDIVHLLHKNV